MNQIKTYTRPQRRRLATVSGVIAAAAQDEEQG